MDIYPALLRRRSPFLCSLYLLALLVLLAPPAAAQRVIRDDATGGDCQSGGSGDWDAGAKRCTLRADLQGTIELAADGLTLDGDGHLLTPRAGDAVAVASRGHSKSHVEDLAIRGFSAGIVISGGSGHRIERNAVTGGPAVPNQPSCGIDLSSVTGAAVIDNTVERNASAGICVSGSRRVEISKNHARKNRQQEISLSGSDRNWILKNEATGAAGGNSQGIELFASSDNLVAGNSVGTHRGAGIWISTSDRNLVLFNTASGNTGGGVAIDTANDNRVLCNDTTDGNLGVDISFGSARNLSVLNNHLHQDTARDGAAGANRFDLPAPVGGSYWEVNAPFCVDANADGFCDAPHPFVGNADNLPHKNPIPWRFDPLTCLAALAPPPEEGPEPKVDAAYRAVSPRK